MDGHRKVQCVQNTQQIPYRTKTEGASRQQEPRQTQRLIASDTIDVLAAARCSFAQFTWLNKTTAHTQNRIDKIFKTTK